MAGKKPISARRKLLRTLAKQSHEAYALRNLQDHLELSMLSFLLRCAKPRARHVVYQGVKFQIVHSLVYRAAVCPDSGIKLVAALDL